MHNKLTACFIKYEILMLFLFQHIYDKMLNSKCRRCSQNINEILILNLSIALKFQSNRNIIRRKSENDLRHHILKLLALQLFMRHHKSQEVNRKAGYSLHKKSL